MSLLFNFSPCIQYSKGSPSLAREHCALKYSVYLAIINGDLLAALYDEFRDRLLEKNVRSFLQVKGGVNKGIRDTLRDEPDMFLAYNNGISVTAESVEIVRDENGKPSIKRIRDMQIVNGGQTTALLTKSEELNYGNYDPFRDFSGGEIQCRAKNI